MCTNPLFETVPSRYNNQFLAKFKIDLSCRFVKLKLGVVLIPLNVRWRHDTEMLYYIFHEGNPLQVMWSFSVFFCVSLKNKLLNRGRIAGVLKRHVGRHCNEIQATKYINFRGMCTISELTAIFLLKFWKCWFFVDIGTKWISLWLFILKINNDSWTSLCL